jgi:hypothetical protein
LDDIELKIFLRMVGKRCNIGNRELKLTCERFPNRSENQKYIIYELETLIAEAKRLRQEYETTYRFPNGKPKLQSKSENPPVKKESSLEQTQPKLTENHV